MSGPDLLQTNLLQTNVLAFLLGVLGGFIRSELELPKAVIKRLALDLRFPLRIALPFNLPLALPLSLSPVDGLAGGTNRRRDGMSVETEPQTVNTT